MGPECPCLPRLDRVLLGGIAKRENHRVKKHQRLLSQLDEFAFHPGGYAEVIVLPGFNFYTGHLLIDSRWHSSSPDTAWLKARPVRRYAAFHNCKLNLFRFRW